MHISPPWRIRIGLVVCLAGLTPTALAVAQQSPDADRAAGLESEVREVLRAYISSFNEHDAAAVASHWSPQGVYVDRQSGRRVVGGDALLAEFTSVFKSQPEIRLAGQVDAVRSIKPDVALADGTSTLFVGGGEPIVSTYSALLVRQGDKWLLDSVHESDLPNPTSSYEALRELEWLVGHWRDEAEHVQVDTHVRWSPERAFLIRSFAVTREDETTSQGTQVIGWDPLQKQIRSWTFNSDGSFGEATWSRNGEEWFVKTGQVLADGSVVSATQVVTPHNADSFDLQTIGMAIDGAPAESSPPVRVVRVAESGADTASADQGGK